MPVPKSEFDDLRPMEYSEPAEVLDPDEMYTVYEIARLLQGLEPGRKLDPETEQILLDWTIPWMLDHAGEFVFAEPAADDEPGHYGLATDGETTTDGEARAEGGPATDDG